MPGTTPWSPLALIGMDAQSIPLPAVLPLAEIASVAPGPARRRGQWRVFRGESRRT